MASKPWKMPERQPEDGEICVSRLRDGAPHLRMTHAAGNLVLSEYNAARLFGILALFLEIPLPPALGKAIKLTRPGDNLNATMGFAEPKTLGDKLAQSLLGQALEKGLGVPSERRVTKKRERAGGSK